MLVVEHKDLCLVGFHDNSIQAYSLITFKDCFHLDGSDDIGWGILSMDYDVNRDYLVYVSGDNLVRTFLFNKNIKSVIKIGDIAFELCVVKFI